MRLFPISLFCWQKATMPYVSGRMKYNLGETNGLSEQHSLVARITNVNFYDYTAQHRHPQLKHLQLKHTDPYERRYANPYEHLQRLSQQILKIDEIITGVSLLTGTVASLKAQ